MSQHAWPFASVEYIFYLPNYQNVLQLSDSAVGFPLPSPSSQPAMETRTESYTTAVPPGGGGTCRAMQPASPCQLGYRWLGCCTHPPSSRIHRGAPWGLSPTQRRPLQARRRPPARPSTGAERARFPVMSLCAASWRWVAQRSAGNRWPGCPWSRALPGPACSVCPAPFVPFLSCL